MSDASTSASACTEWATMSFCQCPERPTCKPGARCKRYWGKVLETSTATTIATHAVKNTMKAARPNDPQDARAGVSCAGFSARWGMGSQTAPTASGGLLCAFWGVSVPDASEVKNG